MKPLKYSLLFCFAMALNGVCSDEVIAKGTIMKEGVVYPLYAVGDQSYFNSQWYPNPYANQAEFYAELGLDSEGFPLAGTPDPVMLYRGYDTLEDLLAYYGYPDLQAVIVESFGPEGTVEEMYLEWYGTDVPIKGDYNTADIFSDPAKTAFFLASIGDLPLSTLADLTKNSPWPPNVGVPLFDSLLTMSVADPEYSPLLRNIFDQAIKPSNSLYEARQEFDFTTTSLAGVNLAGVNLAGMQVTGAQLNDVALGAGYDSSNFSGLDMTGWNPPYTMIGMPPFIPITPNGPSLQNVDFTNARNLSPATLALSTKVTGLILTGTGITRDALIAAMVTAGRDEAYAVTLTSGITF